MELRNHNALGAVDYESALLGHIGNRAEEHVLNHGGEILVVGVGAIQLKLGFEGNAVGLTAFQTLLDGVARGIDVIVEEFKHEVVAGVGDREIFGKHLVKTFVVPLFRGSVELKEVAERLKLDLEEIGVRKGILYRCKIYAGFISG